MFLYPKEIIADIYISKVGGVSDEIGKREIGINAKAVEMNTSIIMNETFATLKFLGDDKPYLPYFMRKRYKVVGIERWMDCYKLSMNGEVVFSSEIEEVKDKIGETVIINTVESFRIDRDYSSVIKAIKSLKERIWGLEKLERRN